MRNRLIPILLAGAMLSSCGSPNAADRSEGGSTVSVAIPKAEPADPAEDGVETSGGPASNTTDRIVCRAGDGRTVLDDFGTEMDPGDGRITYTSTTSGLFTIQYGDCTMMADAPRPEGWRPIIPGYPDPATTFAKGSVPSPQNTPPANVRSTKG